MQAKQGDGKGSGDRAGDDGNLDLTDDCTLYICVQCACQWLAGA